MHIDIPNYKVLEIATVILDLNGTITIDGKLIDGVKERIELLKKEGLQFRLFTGDTLGTGAAIAAELGIGLHITKNSSEKLEEAKKLDLGQMAVIANGRIDLELFQNAALRICTLQEEGAYAPLLAETDVIVKDVNHALDLFIHKSRLIATLRK